MEILEKLFKSIFLFLLYCSNISTAIFIYPIIYFIFGVDSETLKWYYFGIIFSVYELGKFLGLFLWGFFSPIFSNIILILISFGLICILNLSYIFCFNIYHILIIRFLSGFFNNIGKLSKEIHIQLGLKEKQKLITFFISITSTLLSLFLPSIISQKIVDKNEVVNNTSIPKVYKITIYFALINLLSIAMCLILIIRKNLRIRKKNKNFIQMSNNLEKLEYSRNIPNKENIKNPQSTSDYNRSRDIKHNKKFINLKIKENMNDNQNSGRIIINSYGEKMTSNRYDIVNRKEDESKLGKRGSLNLFAGSKNSETGVKDIAQPNELKINYNIKNKLKKEKIKKNKIFKYTFIHILIEISDTLCLIWALIILYVEYNGNSLYISFAFSCIRILGEIISFPINTIIIKNTIYYSHYQLKKFGHKIIIMNILLFFISLLSNISIFMYYNYFLKNKIILLIIFISFLIRNIFSIINIQLFKIYLSKDFNNHRNNIISLGKYRQYSCSFVKTIIFVIGSCGYYLIYDITIKGWIPKIFTEFPKLIFILYFIIFPAVISFILILAYHFFI